ncbi:hypothetical protein TRFO_23780 [Tritrichomonas foetus]|uniref:Uncharacterized protein n=1 Tax=Tritrichomonas foetus TaxID=1144522 RepID=A0A1J4KEL5_9EUKA|nr:hypothetical protein TRFO_23780 [Tritrichomonas foetus]|eukprot:OHT07837.1 hypothetical protein TRFO_23780 [Tritrichomonas foetus]
MSAKPPSKRSSAKQDLEKIFNTPDAIMRPDIIDLLADYSKNNGKVENVAPVLLSHYHGYPNMIDIVATILKSINHDPQKIIEQHANKTMIDFFRLDYMDKLILTQKKVPKWVHIMFQSPFWNNTIFELAKKHPESIFIAYCMNKICVNYPDTIKSLPSYYISYKSFSSVIQSILKRMRNSGDPELLKTFVKIISTDDLTLFHGALLCRDLPNKALMEITNLLTQSEKAIFDKTLLALDECNGDLSNILTSQKQLTINDLNILSAQEHVSQHLQSLIVQKIETVLKNSSSQDVITAAVNCMLKLTHTEVSEEQKSFICACFSFIKTSIRYEDKLAIVLAAVKTECFVNTIFDITLTLFDTNTRQSSPQAKIIDEIAFKYPKKVISMIPKVLDVLKKNESHEILVCEVFEIFKYFIKLGFAIPVLKEYSEFIQSKIKHCVSSHRSFIKDVISIPKNIKNPSQKSLTKFIEATTFVFNNQYIAELVVPTSTTNLSKTDRECLYILKTFFNLIPTDISLPPDAESSLEDMRSRIEYFNI